MSQLGRLFEIGETYPRGSEVRVIMEGCFL